MAFVIFVQQNLIVTQENGSMGTHQRSKGNWSTKVSWFTKKTDNEKLHTKIYEALDSMKLHIFSIIFYATK